MERATEIFAVIHLTTMGLSHILAPRAWAEFFIELRAKGDPGVFAVGFMSLMFGSIIVSFHNVWVGGSVVLTVLGWLQVVKGLLYFTFPAIGRRGLARVSIEGARNFVYAGFALLAVAAWTAYGWSD